MDLEFVSDRAVYLTLFRPGTRHRGESSTNYSTCGRYPGVPAAIAREIQDPKIVYLVRDPVERLVASVQQMGTAREPERRQQYADAVAAESGTIKILAGNLEDPRNWHVDEGRYMTQVKRFLEYFPADSILVVDSDDLRFRREEAVNRVLGFLDLDPLDDPGQLAFEVNTAGEKIRDAGLYLAFARSPSLRRVLDRVPGDLRRPAIRYLRGLTGTPISKLELEPDLRQRLEDFYRPEAEALREFTGQPFSTWSV